RPGLAANELGDVRVQLLRHHRRAGRRLLRQPDEPELGRRPEHELLADPGEVRTEHRAGIEVVESEVAVADGIDRISYPRAPWGRQLEGRARDRRRAEGRRARLPGREAKPFAVPLEHLEPGEQVVSDRQRLDALQMRVARHWRLRLL